MAYDPKSDEFLSPCDLCGSFSFTTLQSREGSTVHRCSDCGLVTVSRPPRGANGSAGGAVHGTVNGAARNGHRPVAASPVRVVPFLPPFKRALDRVREGVPSILLVGGESLAFHAAARRVGAKVTAVVDPGTPVPADVVANDSSIELAPFIPEQFDVIVCAGCIETFESPSMFFERTRAWLSTGGVLLIGARNASSLAARLWPSRWMQRNASGVEHLLSTPVIRRYASRFGFDVASVHARSTARVVRRVVSADGHHLGALGRALAIPVAAASNVLNLGDELWVELTKRGVTVRPIMKPLEEEQSPGLAPAALYTGVRRDAVLIDG